MLFKTKTAAKILDMQPWQIQSYAKQGFVKPAVGASGAGTRRAYDLVGLVKLAILNRLSSDGFDLRTIRPIFSGLFDIPAFHASKDSELLQNIDDWFRNKLLITSNKFSQRKLVRRDRFSACVEDLLLQQPGLYLVDLGSIVGGVLSSVKGLAESDRGDKEVGQ